MNKSIAYVVSIIAGLLLFGCVKDPIDSPGMNVITVHPAKSHNGDALYPIGSVFVGGGTVDPSKGLSNRCHIYKEQFAEGPAWDKVQALVEIYGFKYNDVEYQSPDQYVEQIIINGLDESLGLGTTIDIPMKQGKYQGGNDLIESVRIQAYKFSSSRYEDGQIEYNDDADINIVIKSKKGDVISILYSNATTPWDGYY